MVNGTEGHKGWINIDLTEPTGDSSGKQRVRSRLKSKVQGHKQEQINPSVGEEVNEVVVCCGRSC